MGESNTWLAIDEMGNFATPAPIDLLRSTLRSASGVPTYFRGSCNPGGVGHSWIKARYIDPAPPNRPWYDPLIETFRVFIPSKVSDNKILVDNDPTYISRIKASGPDWLVKAWLDGDWNIVAGGMFDDVWYQHSEKIVLANIVVPEDWEISRSFDWGSSAPFSVGWWATAKDTPIHVNGRDVYMPVDSKVRINEWYGWSGTPNKGVGITAREIARGINEREEIWFPDREIVDGIADSSIFNTENGDGIADDFEIEGVYWNRADKSPGSRIQGWDKMRQMLINAGTDNDEPALFISNRCRQFIRTVPNLPRDPKNLDDVDTGSEDHIGDETRYFIRQPQSEGGIVKATGI